ncbi:MAG: type III pantothenate kinase [Oscillospiraceae bacterium]|nr:type III pantothenate kinase [Oscillospiraceae bacterium]
MILTLDVGNSSIVLCLVENGDRLARFVLASNRDRTADEYSVLMELLARREGMDLHTAQGAIIASVVPHLTPVISQAVLACTGRQPLTVGPGVRSGLNIRMDDPAELGGDLVAAAVAVLGDYPLPCVIVDMGTATAVGVIDGKGSYIGGLICPGLSLSRDGLARGASQLSEVNIDLPKRLIGRNTRDSMRSGLIYGTAAMLDGILARIEEDLGEQVSVVVTGEAANDVIPCCRRPGILVDDDLIMRGLWRIYCRNREQ